MKTKQVIGMIAVLAIIGAYFGAMIGGLFGAPLEGSVMGSVLCNLPLVPASANFDKQIKALREQIADKQTEMRALIETTEKEDRDFSEDEQTQYAGFETELRGLQGRLTRLEKLEKESGGKAQQQRKLEDTTDQEKREQEVEAAFRSYLAKGFGALTADERTIVQERALAAGTGNKGGFTIPQGFSNKLEVAMKQIGGVMAVAEIMETDTGNDIDYPTMNDNANVGAILGENTAAGDSTEPDFGTIAIKAYTYSSKPVLVSNLLLQDSAFNLEQYLADALARRIVVAFNQHATTADGVGKPKGITTAATKGADALVDSITYDNLVDTMHSVDPYYRKNAKWMFHDTTLAALRKLKDNTGRPIFQESVKDGEPSTLLGKEYIINNDMPEIGASAKSVVFGDYKKYLVRRVKNYGIKRLEERYAEFNQTAFLLFVRMDGQLIDAGTNPIKYLQHAAS